MPEPARKFLLGGGSGQADADPRSSAIGDWFVRETRAHAAELDEWASRHEEADLDGAQVLDRLLWFPTPRGTGTSKGQI